MLFFCEFVGSFWNYVIKEWLLVVGDNITIYNPYVLLDDAICQVFAAEYDHPDFTVNDVSFIRFNITLGRFVK